ncbi:protein CEPU-1-like [Actinia tenebrosa]|uniref:Protein CEPU-1-like n=1 Tax=Actinia tenebrosa TaxID=6105 RepID=A0A6P8HR15_ACTTE|nr:protein CEPU-1-like [Actinia tenebrosa]
MNLLLKALPLISSEIQLVVTTRPQFTSQFQANNIVLEGGDLRISCSAIGNPTPNINWVLLKNQAKEIKSQGVGFADLVIQNITRHQNGTYQCQATNNPNDYPVKTKTQVTVWYIPNITFLNWTVDEKTILLCQASGQPRPLFKWYYADGTQVESGVTEITSGIRMVLKIPDSNSGLYGMYRCNATNEEGWNVGYLNITRIHLPTAKTATDNGVTVTLKRGIKKEVAPTIASLGTTPNCIHALPSSHPFYQVTKKLTTVRLLKTIKAMTDKQNSSKSNNSNNIFYAKTMLLP